jgi:type II restriction/modification system DNA methylase subunit YeeA
MNRNKLKSYAPNARRDFIKAITDRAAYYGLTRDKIEPISEQGDVAIIAGKPFPRAVAAKRKKLEDRIKQQSFEQVMEAMAYTWFNRFVAIRYMELHGYLDHGYRVLSTTDYTDSTDKKNGKSTAFVIPDILKHAEHLDLPGLDREEVIDLKMEGTKEDELYNMLLIAQCNALHDAMPFLFEKVNDETELLLPDNLLHSDSLIRKLVSEVPEEEWKDVEIIGWLYQFYISEKKDEVFEGLKKNKKITPENIPAATQLFTPHWIVRYLVENSLGRLWMLNRPHSSLIHKMDYYIKPEDQETDFLKISSPEEIKICDPACGSGHMLVYAFDLLYSIYEEQGYKSTEIPRTILENNLYGIEIDKRAGALAAFALVIKAREKDRRFFQRKDVNGKTVEPRICVLENIRFEEGELKNYMDFIGRDLFTSPLQTTLRQFEEANNFGSLIRPDVKDVDRMLKSLESKKVSGHLFLSATHEKVQQVLQQDDYLSPKYHVVVANPPYMGGKGMNGRLGAWVNENYPDSKSDLFAAFIERGLDLLQKRGFNAMVTMESWMFLSSFEKLRSKLVNSTTIQSMVHMPYLGKGGTSMGINFGTTAFITNKLSQPDYAGHYCYVRYFETDERGVPKEFPPKNERLSIVSSGDFKKIPGIPIAYWAGKSAFNAFEKFPPLEDVGLVRQGASTSDNARFLRLWHEVSILKIGFDIGGLKEANYSVFKWFPYNKGGEFRKWYGNQDVIINYENDGYELKEFQSTLNQGWTVRLKSREYYFKPSVSWPKITSGLFSARYYPAGFIFDVAGCCYFPYVEDRNKAVVSFLNSNVAKTFLQFLSPTLNFEIEQIKKLPYAEDITVDRGSLNKIFELSLSDWDSYETSWDFTNLPLLHPDYRQTSLKTTYQNLRTCWREMVLEMQQLEEENNRIFIEAYGLQDELTPDVPLSEITLTCNPHYRYGGVKSENELEALLLNDIIKELLSYAIGCMMGRYSHDKPGLIYAHSGNKNFDPDQYRTFPADSDGIIPITDIDWFEDDAANRIVEFISVAWPKEHLEENLKFVAESLGQKRGESSREAIRSYLASGFYKHHLSMYKRRPIYWLFSSGKQQAFQCLVYLHRYNESLLSRMRTEYVIPLQGKINARIEQLKDDVKAASSTAHRKKLEKEHDKLIRQRTELQAFDEKLRHYADQRISLDLDDGVKVNYGKFGDLLAEVKAVTGKVEE